jgi:thiamine transport system ATP-binding protein
MTLAVEHVGLAFERGAPPVLDDVSVQVARGEIVGLLGPSGSGKSTLLRVIAGILVPDRGRVCWDGDDITSMPTHLRRFGFVFQDEQLFPHRDVAGNVAFGLRMQRRPKREIDARVDELLALVGLAGFERRRVTDLSGGEAKRVALARALAPAPRLLLLDEPLTGLDRDLHDRLAIDVRGVLTEVGISAIHVTHDLDEATTVADRVVRLGELSATP